ncbi:MAG: hypothetical protein GXO10_06960 [Crenarchaeota archaeon]|nr:hypothetical protein [Thermoproteota archaeon]
MKKVGVVFITHGSLCENYVKEVNKIAEKVVEKLKNLMSNVEIVPVVSYLHHQHPDPDEAIRELLSKNVDKIIAFSMFVVEGRHGREDTMEILGKYGDKVIYAGTLWPDDRVVDIISDKILKHLK